jgi:hypothetical protein
LHEERLGNNAAACQLLASSHQEGELKGGQKAGVVSGETPSRQNGETAHVRTDEIVPQSGVYKVRHQKHRLPHEVSFLRDQQFPRCAQCQNAVIFELLRAVTDEAEAGISSPRICLYELPVLEDDTAKAG